MNRRQIQVSNKQQTYQSMFFHKQLDLNLWVIDDSKNNFGLPVGLMVISLKQLTYIKPFSVYIVPLLH